MKRLLVIPFILITVVINARSVPYNYPYIWNSKAHLGLIEFFEDSKEKYIENDNFFMSYSEVFRGDEYESYNNYLGPLYSTLMWDGLRLRDLTFGTFFVSAYTHVHHERSYSGIMNQDLLAGLSLKSDIVDAYAGWVINYYGNGGAFAGVNVMGIDLKTILNKDLQADHLSIYKLFDVWILGKAGPKAFYSAYLDTVKAGIVWEELSPVEFVNFNIEVMADVYNRGLGGGMSHGKAECEIDAIETGFSDSKYALNFRLGGSYSEDMFYQGLWGGLFEMGIFNTAYVRASYNYHDMLEKNPVKDSLTLSFGLNISQSPVNVQQVIKQETTITDLKANRSISVDTFLRDENMKSKAGMKISRKQEVTALVSVISAVAAGAAVLLMDTDEYYGIHAAHAGIAGGLVGFYIFSIVVDLF